jgi:hypothetical protein
LHSQLLALPTPKHNNTHMPSRIHLANTRQKVNATHIRITFSDI